MSRQLSISIGQHSDKGRKDINQDFHGVYIPDEPMLTSKGIAIALADGISSSTVSQIASEATVRGFLEDYFCTSEAWSVKKSAQRVLDATNSWLHSQTRQSQFRYDNDKGYVCTLSALVLKSTAAYLFHTGDTRIYRLRDNSLEQLTTDHRLWVAPDKSYLSRAMGINPQLEIDHAVLPLEIGDIFILVTDGVYDFVEPRFMIAVAGEHNSDLNQAAQAIVAEAYSRGSHDNLTAQIIRVDSLPSLESSAVYPQLMALPLPPLLEARMEFDGFQIVREIHASSRSHVYLATDPEFGKCVIKIPSIDLRNDAAYLERFQMEEWIARRMTSAYVLRALTQTRKRNYLYLTTEYVEGQNLSQWMIDNPHPGLEAVRNIVEQIAKGLRAFHRLEMLHQDLRPDNIMIDSTGSVKIIDFGSVQVAGIAEIATSIERPDILGTAQYTAPEYFLGEAGSWRSDLFSLAVITYQMLTGQLPYGAEVAKSRTKTAQGKLRYQSALAEDREIPAWIDDVLRKALHPQPFKRYDELSEFTHDLRKPNQEFLNKTRPPLIERNPVGFWKGVSLILALVIVALLNN
ncbi:MAG: bifunctional protein-serine/threonine kinase/phosphatase [Pseudomonadota bacterium]